MAGPAEANEPVTGRASVVDGDTIEIAGERIRFNGVDAPESWQICHDVTVEIDGRARRFEGDVAADSVTFVGRIDVSGIARAERVAVTVSHPSIDTVVNTYPAALLRRLRR